MVEKDININKVITKRSVKGSRKLKAFLATLIVVLILSLTVEVTTTIGWVIVTLFGIFVGGNMKEHAKGPSKIMDVIKSLKK